MSSTKSVLGLVRNRAQADSIVAALLRTGFVRTDVSTLYVDGPPTGQLVRGQSLPNPDHTIPAVSIGGAVGTVLGLLAGIGVLWLPGYAAFIDAAPIMTAIGSVVAGTIFGAITGALAGTGVSEVEAREYERKIRGGAILVLVHGDDRSQRAHARKVLDGYGATNIATVADRYVYAELSPTLVA